MNLQIQSVLYHNDPNHILRAASGVRRAVDHLSSKLEISVTLCYGDCSSEPMLDDIYLSNILELLGDIRFKYQYFGRNLGSAEGHNLLAADLTEGFVLIQNPDVVGEHSYLEGLFECFRDAGCGMAEARQLPIEHSKDYSIETGETPWATTACAMIPVNIFHQLNGFDSKTFFLYCDDLDFSWRLRLSGKKIIFQPASIVFHDKRLGSNANWSPSKAEQYYSIEAAIFMAHKWSNPQRVQKLLEYCDHVGGEIFSKAAAEYRRRLNEGSLPFPIDEDHQVSFFEGDLYSRHRFSL